MQKKRSILLIGILIFICLFSGCTNKLPSPLLMECPDDIFIPETDSNPSFLANQENVYEFLLKEKMTNVEIHFLEDDALIFSDRYEYYETASSSYTFSNYYRYDFKTGEITPITAFLSRLYTARELEWASTDDSLAFQLDYSTPLANYASNEPYAQKLFSYSPETNLVYEMDKVDSDFLELVGQGDALYALSGKTGLLGARSKTFITKYSLDTQTSKRVLRATANNWANSGEILQRIFATNDGFAVLVENQKTKSLRMDFYDVNWKLARSVALPFAHQPSLDLNTISLYGNSLLVQFQRNLKIYDLSAENPDSSAQLYLDFSASCVTGELPKTRILLKRDPDSYSDDLLYGLSSTGELVSYSFYPFVADGYTCVTALQNGNTVLLGYQQNGTPELRYIVTDLATLDTHLKK